MSLKLALFAAVVVVLLALPVAASAQYPTPTPIPQTSAEFDPPAWDTGLGEMAMPTEIVQGYNQFEQLEIFEFIWMAIVLGIILAGLASIVRHVKNL